MVFPDFADPSVWVSLLTLTFLEIVLGVDNIIFISIVAGKLPEQQQRKARNMGLLLAMGFRVGLLLTINWIISLKEPLFTIPAIGLLKSTPLAISVKDLILIAGGLFLIFKSTLEINYKLQKPEPEEKERKVKINSYSAAVIQIVLVDAVFSFDSILTAIGLVENVVTMIIAVVISIIIMMMFAGRITRIINSQPTLQMLALSFLVVIGVVLVADGIHQEISKSIIYSCLAFSLLVEALNIRLRKNRGYVELNTRKDGDKVK
jgi:predicted tellurium resistance membrane protein TerC